MSISTSTPIRLAVVVGSTREGRRGPMVADWFADVIAGRDDVEVDMVDLAEFRLPGRYTFTSDPAVTELREHLDAADAFVVVTPEYNHSYPASLKHAVDFANAQWRRKVVGFVSYGGVFRGPPRGRAPPPGVRRTARPRRARHGELSRPVERVRR